jgi:hypothetical protein
MLRGELYIADDPGMRQAPPATGPRPAAAEGRAEPTRPI